MFARLASFLLVTSLLAGCGMTPLTPKLPVATQRVQAQSAPGWGQKTWTTMVVPKEVMAYVTQEAAAIEGQFQQEYGQNRNFRLNWQFGVVASQDGFKTVYRAGNPGNKPPETPQALEFNLGPAPAGSYQYYLVITANLVEYDAAGNFRQIGKTYGPRYVSNYGRNFAGEAI
ncbi:MAG TPA: hypothetical protein V6D05_02975 [Stenomitos sp.]